MGKRVVLSLSITLSSLLNGAATSSVAVAAHAQLPVYAIPGQSGDGSSPAYVAQLLGIKQMQVTAIETPKLFPDFGQSRCQACLKGIKKPGIIHATSQGTATAIRYAAENPGIVKALILEATMASGNSAINHTISGPWMPALNGVARWPGAYYWAPYLAKLRMFHLYSPSGTQPIHVAHKIDKNIPIIIAHSDEDPQLSYQDACTLYYQLRATGHMNTYLISIPGSRHINVLEYEGSFVQGLLAKHGIGAGLVEDVASQPDRVVFKDKSGRRAIQALSDFQPNPIQFESTYDALIAKEKIHTRIGYGINTVLAAAVFYGAFRVARTAPAQQLGQRMQALLSRAPALASPMLARA